MSTEPQVSVYDGRRYLGMTRPSDGEWLALDCHGHCIGQFATQREALDAISACDLVPRERAVRRYRIWGQKK